MNRNTIKFLSIFATLALFSNGCSTASVRMIPGEKKHQAIARDIEREGAEEAAIEAAEDFCEDREKQLVVLSHKTNYTGSMNESDRKAVRNASKAAQIIGGRDTTVGQAGTVGKQMTSDRDYESEVVFRCK